MGAVARAVPAEALAEVVAQAVAVQAAAQAAVVQAAVTARADRIVFAAVIRPAVLVVAVRVAVAPAVAEAGVDVTTIIDREQTMRAAAATPRAATALKGATGTALTAMAREGLLVIANVTAVQILQMAMTSHVATGIESEIVIAIEIVIGTKIETETETETEIAIVTETQRADFDRTIETAGEKHDGARSVNAVVVFIRRACTSRPTTHTTIMG